MTTNFTLLQKITITSASSPSSITFSNIPQSFDHLKIITNARSTGGSAYSGINMLINNDSTVANYKNAYVEGYNNATSGNANTNAYTVVYAAGVSADANVFCGGEITILNYKSTSAKAYISNSGYNGNSTTSYPTDLSGFNYSGTSAITSLVFTLNAGNFTNGTTIEMYGMTNQTTTPTVLPKATGGNIIVNDGTYWYHAFLSSGTFTPQQALIGDVLVVAGGGGGSCSSAAGGGAGAGGLLGFNSQSLLTQNYAVTVGAGGAGGVNTNGSYSYSSVPTNGGNSQFGSLTTVIGGGIGGGYTAAGNGGSGGGGAPNSGAGGTGTAGQGNAGGVAGSGGNFYSGGGGGAGAAGGAGTGGLAVGGVGSSAYSSWGLATVTGQNVGGTVYYAGGGGGSSNGAGGGAGGYGGGAAGTASNNTSGNSATANTGGGAGGASNSGATPVVGGNGGSGIVIVRYTIA